ncbi:MAG TPA: tetratricopeptide repeat protein, partial [Pirellulaceae bacterium]
MDLITRRTVPNTQVLWRKPHGYLIVRFACVVFLGGGILGPHAGRSQEGTSRALKKAPSGPDAAAIYSDAANLQNNGEFPLAAEEWRKFLKQFPTDPMIPQVRHQLGVCLLQANQLTEAASQFEQAVAGSEGFDFKEEALVNWGWCLYSQGVRGKESKFAAALPVFERVLKEFPEGAIRDQALFYLGECHYLTGDRAGAEPHYRALVEEFPKSEQRPDAMYALGVLLQESDREAESNQVFEAFVSEYSRHELVPEIQLRLGESRLSAKEYGAAAEAFGAASQAKDFPLADHAAMRQGACLEFQSQFREATVHFTEFVKRFPKSEFVGAAAVAAARNFFRLKDGAAMETWLANAEEASPSFASEAAHWRAQWRIQESKPEEALQIAQAAIDKVKVDDPWRGKLSLDVADALYAIPDRRAEALAAYQKMAEGLPKSFEAGQALYNAAYGLLEAKQYEESRKLADQFLSQYPDHERLADVRHVRAESSLMAENYAAAELEFAALLDDFPDHSEAARWRSRLGFTLHELGKHDEAVALARQAASAAGSSEYRGESEYLAAVSLSKKGDVAGAIKSLRTFLKSHP